MKNTTNFKLSDAISKLETMNPNKALPFDSFDGYPKTVDSLKTDLEEILDMYGDRSITEIEGDDAIEYLIEILS